MNFIYWSFLLFITFVAAEGLTRKAFGNHIQLWQVWQPNVASSFSILGRTIGAYLLVPIMFFYEVLFFIYTTRYWGWWNPSDALFNPDILATYFPWWQSIVLSLRAGFWEECLFRAIPFSCAALLGNRFGKKNWWIAGAFILQAVLFGAVHANYPALPAYARLVEILFVSMIFGFVYLVYGLLPAIITHFIYDVVWFSLPVFVSVSSSAWINQIAIIILALIPLWIVLFDRLKTGAWHLIPNRMYNASWKPTIPKKVNYKKSVESQRVSLPFMLQLCFLIAGAGGLTGWFLTTQFKSDGLPFTITRSQALDTTKKILEDKKVDPSQWYSMTIPLRDYHDAQPNGTQQRFIWQEGGKNIYHTLLGSYVTSPYWVTRYVKFEGPIMDRAEEHRVYVKPDGTFYRYQHILPETQPGEKLSEQEARAIAYAKIYQQFKIQPEQLKEISAVVNKHPERLDWIFTFACPSDYPLEKGEARIDIVIAGDTISDTFRYIHVPEEWKRSDENKQYIARIIQQFCTLLIYLFIIFGSLYAFMQWHMHVPYYMLVPYFSILALIYLFEYANSWPIIVSQFNTSQPFRDQLFRSFGMQPFSLLIRAAMLAVMLSFVNSWKGIYNIAKNWFSIGIAISIGITTAAAQSICIKLFPSVAPTWPNYTPLAFLLPLNAGINSYLLHYISLTMFLMLCIVILNTVSDYFQRRKLLTSISLIFFGIVMSGLLYPTNVPLLLANGISTGIIFLFSYVLFIRFAYSFIPLACAAHVILLVGQQAGFNAHPYASLVSGGAIILISLIAWYWNKTIQPIK